MVVSLKTKLNIINAVEALVLEDESVRLKLPGVLWLGWSQAPLYSPTGTGDIAEEWNYVHAQVFVWNEVELNGREETDLKNQNIENGRLFRPLPASLDDLEALRDDLADVLREENLADAEFKQKEQAFRDANDRLIKEREAVKELRKLNEADARNTAMRLFAVNGGTDKKLTEGINAEYYTATAPYPITEAVFWAIENAPWLLTLNAALVDSFVLALADQNPLAEAMKGVNCPLKPEQRVRTEIEWKTLTAIATQRANIDAALGKDDTDTDGGA